MNIEIPKIGMTFSRILMPQINDKIAFIKNIRDSGVSYKEEKVDPNSLKSTQSEFDKEKIAAMMIDPKSDKNQVIISNDNYVLDGHHRWIVAFNKKQKVNVLRVDLPILELMILAKSFQEIEYKPVLENVKNVIKESLRQRKY
jgi:hypothetical protein